LHTKQNLDTENLNYSAAGLVSTFKKYFPTPESTAGYARQPKDSK
jgi:predicted chitinase